MIYPHKLPTMRRSPARLAWAAAAGALLLPLLAPAMEIQVEGVAMSDGTAASLVNMRDPRIAGMPRAELLPADGSIRRNIVRYPAVPPAPAPSSLWPAPSSGPSPLLTYIGAVAAGIAAGNPNLPYTSNEMIKPAGAYDSKTPP
ncbi:hypothetical protein [Herbaspirillum autotrophicum]|uniref:hypothetical protein n=1 Tax=Herbaspirillum autotrophicum TaxID=180195 RepID=UPI00067DA46C|nr:hypothetical protein [Herbaspirillum autotrophicum]